jgi:hypothetical protein
MDGTLATALLHGLALGGVLAVTGAWSRLARLGAAPHLGVGAVAGVVAVAGLRLAVWSPWAALVICVLLGGLLGAGLSLLHARATTAGTARGYPYLPDLAVLAGLIAMSVALRPPTAIALPFGPLGGQPGTGAALLAAATGGLGAFAIASRRVPAGRTARWAAAGAAVAVPTVLAAGALSAGPMLLSGIIGVPDTAGLALRATAVAFAARRGVWETVVAGLLLGVGEMVLTTLQPGSGLGWLPAVLALAFGAVLHERDRKRVTGRVDEPA